MVIRILYIAFFAALLAWGCGMKEEGGRVVGGLCEMAGATACDDEMAVVLECTWDLLWQVKDYCAAGCTEELGYAHCIGGGTDNWIPDNWTPDDDNQLPDSAESLPDDDQQIPVDDAVTTDDTPVITDEAEVEDDTVTDETEIEDDTITDDATATDDVVVTDDATVTDDAVITDDATVTDNDTVADCGADWTLNDDTGTCYRYFAGTKSFEEAESACVTEQGHLVNVASAAENGWVRDNLGIPADTAYWLGYTAKDAVGPGTGSANGNSCSSALVTNASGGTYSLNTSDASTLSTGCTCSGTVSGKFVSFRLNNPTTGYWEIVADTNNDAVITIHEDPGCSSCTADRVACVDAVSAGGKEVFNNQYQLSSSHWYVIMVTGKSSNVTGTLYIRPPITTGNFADHYSWTDGVSHSYHNFATGQPDYGSGNERCAQVSAATVWGEWNDNQCSTTLPYVCEKNP